MPHSRRNFLRTAACALGGAGVASTIERLGLMSALAQSGAPSDYRALVCIFLVGGNTGPLVEPLTRQTYQNGTARVPFQLFSHSDQVNLWQTSAADSSARTGWGGRIADHTAALNGASVFPQAVSIAGINTFLKGDQTNQLAIEGAGQSLAQALTLDFSGIFSEFKSRRAAFDQIRTTDLGAALVKADSDIRDRALQASKALSSISFSAPKTTFPKTSFGLQLLQVGRLILARNTLGMKRQIFFTL